MLSGPCGPFYVPMRPQKTREVCEAIAHEVWNGEYAHPELPRGLKRIIDIGAGWGAFAVWALSQYPGAELDAYEPHDKACAFLRRNAPTARTHQVAVTVQSTAMLSVGAHDSLDNWGARTVHGMTAGQPVAVLHPRDLPPCDLLKIDAEGVEPEILENYPHLGGVQALLYEFHNAEHRKRLRAFSERSGFRQLREVLVGSHSEILCWGPSIWIRDTTKGVCTVKDPSSIYTTEWFQGHAHGREEYRSVANVVHELFPDCKYVMDVGCGPGFCLERLKELGHHVKGIDGSVQALSVSPIRDDISIADLTTTDPQFFANDAELIICTEVAEHLDAEHSDKLVDFLTTCAEHDIDTTAAAPGAIYFTAATPGQGGTDHVNEQPHEYWIEKFEARGWKLDRARTEEVRLKLAKVIRWQHWYTQNSMIFVKG
jgi:FkbM family methyltransferase